MVETPLDEEDFDFGDDDKPLQPPDTVGECAICRKPLKVRYHWVYSRWWRNTVHDACAASYDQKGGTTIQHIDQPIPERFAQFNSDLANPEALAAAGAFSPESKYKVLAIIGVPARGKSRLMWATIQAFFGELERTTGAKRWCDYYLFTDLITEQDRTVLAKVKMGRYVFIDDIGSTESYGRERAALQDVIRTRAQKQQWTFLTIDNVDFDRFADVFRERAVTIYLEK